jgi:hypothetical protein
MKQYDYLCIKLRSLRALIENGQVAEEDLADYKAAIKKIENELAIYDYNWMFND